MKQPINGPITSIKDIPVCNDRLYKEVALLMRLEIHQVREMTDFIGEYTAGVMRSGHLETVMLPHFGKFKPKKKKIETFSKVKAHESNGMDMFYRALTGRKVIDKRKSDTNEAI